MRKIAKWIDQGWPDLTLAWISAGLAWASLVVLISALSGCAATAGVGTAATAGAALTSQIPTIANQLYGIAPAIVLQNYQTLHNLRVGMDQIDAAPGMVTTAQPPPVVTPAAPTVTPSPVITPSS
jgi:hypothetical protein